MLIRRKYGFAVVTVAVLLFAGDVVYWRLTADRLRTGYERWVAARVAEGWRIGSGPLSVGGWPKAASVTIPHLQLAQGDPAAAGELAVASAAVTLSVSLVSPASLRISIGDATHLRVAGAPEIVLTGDDNWVSVPLRQSGSYPVDLHADALRLGPANGAWQATVGLLNAHAMITQDAEADPSQPPATFSVSAEAIALPGVVKWPLGTNISSVSLDGQLNGPLPDNKTITGWAEAWRDGGGSLAITHFAMGWGPLGVTSSATLALDEQLQPMGSGNGRFVGYAATLDRLAAGGMLTKSAAIAAKAVLSLMAGSTEADTQSMVDVPLTLQYRTLSMRQVPLLRLPELDWPAR